MNSRAMTKLSDLLQFRNQLSQKKFFGKDVRDTLWLHGFTSSAGVSTARQTFAADGKLMTRIFAPYSVYKGKAALSASPRLPTFTKMDSATLKVDRIGTIMLTFWPAIGERKYDWEKRQKFALSATEVGSLISLGPRDSCEFLHDPAMLSSNAGQVRKSLSIKPHADASGYFISLSVVNHILKTNERFTVPVTTAEFAVMRTAFSFALPHIIGWDRLINQLPKSMDEDPSKVDPQLLDLEWDK
uniref:Single-stranded DNA-bindig protein WHY2, mitochondrial n=1 Tax=Davidia involucrata TaxID=16924 RepID=A0A5B7BHB2_DAVIN